MVRVLIPWKMGLYDNLNGYHPLVASFVDATPKNVEFVVAERGGADGRGSAQVVYQFMRASRKFGSLPVESFPRISDDDFLVKWVLTRDPPAQMYLQTLEEQVDLVLHHTTPVHMTSIPFVCHVENFTTLFFPFLQMGQRLAWRFGPSRSSSS